MVFFFNFKFNDQFSDQENLFPPSTLRVRTLEIIFDETCPFEYTGS